jgi:hypothetical protein
MSEAEQARTIQLLSTPEAAAVLRVKPQSLRVMRIRGTSPRFVRVGNRVFYEAAALAEYLDARTFSSTAAAKAALGKTGSNS